MQQDPDISPLNPLPPAVVALFALIVAIELAFFLGSRGLIGGPAAVGWRLSAVQNYAFSGAILDWMWANNRWPAQHLIRFVTYLFVHGSFTQALFVGVFLLAMGKMVAEMFGGLAMLAIFIVSGVGGALACALLLDVPMPVLGGFPAV